MVQGDAADLAGRSLFVQHGNDEGFCSFLASSGLEDPYQQVLLDARSRNEVDEEVGRLSASWRACLAARPAHMVLLSAAYGPLPGSST